MRPCRCFPDAVEVAVGDVITFRDFGQRLLTVPGQTRCRLARHAAHEAVRSVHDEVERVVGLRRDLIAQTLLCFDRVGVRRTVLPELYSRNTAPRSPVLTKLNATVAI